MDSAESSPDRHLRLPDEELDRYHQLVDEALTLASLGFWADGRATICRGLREAVELGETIDLHEAQWAAELIRLWRRTLQRWDRGTDERTFRALIAPRSGH